jgi:hypothetical protein
MADKEIKSAFEIAMEKLNKIESSTEEERLEWEYLPKGEQLAGKYVKEDFDLFAALNEFTGSPRKFAIKGAAGVLARNISMPHNELIKKTNKKAMDALKVLKNDKGRAEAVFANIRRLFDHYGTQGEQQRKQALASLKSDFEDRLQEAAKQQGLAIAGKMDVEKQPQFQQEWRRLLTQLDSQYIKVLNEYKQELETID